MLISVAPGASSGGLPRAPPRGSVLKNLARRESAAACVIGAATALIKPNLFTIPANSPFLSTLSHSLLKGELIAGFPNLTDPLDLARATIYVPTRRAASALADALLEASGRTSLALPRIAPLGAIEPGGEDAAFGECDEGDAGAAGPAAVGDLSRRMTLASLTRQWGAALEGAIVSVDDKGRKTFDQHQAPLVASTPAEAFALAGDLAGLIDDMLVEGVAWERLRDLAEGAFDAYWRITLDFLEIAAAAWPQWLAERGLVDKATRVQFLIDLETEALTNGVRGPVIVAGSTGTHRATARLIAAVARSSLGAVVLPDLDLALDEASFAAIGAKDEEGSRGLAGHPQAALYQLLKTIGADRRQVKPLVAFNRGAPDARGRFMSEAMRPAETTDFWRRRRDALGDAALEDALAGVTIIVAENETEEALSLAIALREVLETDGKTAALITPDLALARRVSADLSRFCVEVDAFTGASLADSPAGAFARLALEAARDVSYEALAALLKHPLTRLGRGRDDFERAVRTLDLGLFRRIAPKDPSAEISATFAEAIRAARGPYAQRSLSALSDADWANAEALYRDLRSALTLLRAGDRSTPLATRLERHRAALAALAGDEREIERSPNGDVVLTLLATWPQDVEIPFPCSLSEYAELFDSGLKAHRLPPAAGGKTRLSVLGLLEARLLNFDRVALGGLDESVWPPSVSTDAFLNRAMRARLGLSAPERRIGQTAHDFVSALGAREAILSRAKKRGGAPALASRFLQRMAAVAGDESIARCERRGDVYLRMARALDRPARVAPVVRPRPAPDASLRPRKLSVTRIETLRRDPYAIFASEILSIRPLDPIGPTLGPREFGTMWHAALQRYGEIVPPGPLPDDARERFIAILREAFAPALADPSFAALQWPRMQREVDCVLKVDSDWRMDAAQSLYERRGAIEMPLADGGLFTLSARADRIDRLHDGRVRLIDYKTGQPPGVAEIQVGLAPQLTLEAAIVARGGFPELPAPKLAGAVYLKIGGKDGCKLRSVQGADEDFPALVERHFGEFEALINAFADSRKPYVARPFPKFAARHGDYDHLARVQEWSSTGGLVEGDGSADT